MLARATGTSLGTGLEPGPGEAWMAGAKAALRRIEERGPTHIWDPFLEDLRLLLDLWSDISPSEPGVEPICSFGQTGSIYDALGGYISVAGIVTPRGLSFTVNSYRLREVLGLFPGMYFRRSEGRLTVPWSELPSFERLVPILGPLASELEDTGK